MRLDEIAWQATSWGGLNEAGEIARLGSKLAPAAAR